MRSPRYSGVGLGSVNWFKVSVDKSTLSELDDPSFLVTSFLIQELKVWAKVEGGFQEIDSDLNGNIGVSSFSRQYSLEPFKNASNLDLYLKIKVPLGLNLQVYIDDSVQLVKRESLTISFQIMFQVILFIMFIYNLAIWLISKPDHYLPYLFLILVTALWQGFESGVYSYCFYEDVSFNTKATMVFASLYLVGSIVFLSNIALSKDENRKWLLLTLKTIISLLVGSSILALFQAESSLRLNLILIPPSIFGVLFILIKYSTNLKILKWYLIAWMAPILAGLFTHVSYLWDF